MRQFNSGYEVSQLVTLSGILQTANSNPEFVLNLSPKVSPRYDLLKTELEVSLKELKQDRIEGSLHWLTTRLYHAF